jgi:hypothetical protein
MRLKVYFILSLAMEAASVYVVQALVVGHETCVIPSC